MYFLATLSKSLLMHPSSFGPRLLDEVKKALYSSVEGTVDMRYGYIIMVAQIVDIPHGVVQEGGYVLFNVTYKAVVFYPYRNEVMDAIVLGVDSMGIRAQVGPMSVFIYKDQIPSDLTFDQTGPSYVSTDESIRIKKDDKIRLKITGMRFDATDIFGVATIREDYLGFLSE